MPETQRKILWDFAAYAVETEMSARPRFKIHLRYREISEGCSKGDEEEMDVKNE